MGDDSPSFLPDCATISGTSNKEISDAMFGGHVPLASKQGNFDEMSGLFVPLASKQTIADNLYGGLTYGPGYAEQAPGEGIHIEEIIRRIEPAYGLDLSGQPCSQCKKLRCGKVVVPLDKLSRSDLLRVLASLKAEKLHRAVLDTGNQDTDGYAAATDAMCSPESLEGRVCCNHPECLLKVDLVNPESTSLDQPDHLKGHNARHGNKDSLVASCAILHVLHRENAITEDDVSLLMQDVKRWSSWLRNDEVQMLTYSLLMVNNAKALNLPLEGHMGVAFYNFLKCCTAQIVACLLLPHVLDTKYPAPTNVYDVGGERMNPVSKWKWARGSKKKFGTESSASWFNVLDRQVLVRDFPSPAFRCRVVLMLNQWLIMEKPRDTNGKPTLVILKKDWSIVYDAPGKQDPTLVGLNNTMQVSGDATYQNGAGSSTGSNQSDQWRPITAIGGSNLHERHAIMHATRPDSDKPKPGNISKGGTNDCNVQYAAADSSCLVDVTKNDPLKRLLNLGKLINRVDADKYNLESKDLEALVLKKGRTKPAQNGKTKSGWHFNNVSEEDAQSVATPRPEQVVLSTRYNHSALAASGSIALGRKLKRRKLESRPIAQLAATTTLYRVFYTFVYMAKLQGLLVRRVPTKPLTKKDRENGASIASDQDHYLKLAAKHDEKERPKIKAWLKDPTAVANYDTEILFKAWEKAAPTSAQHEMFRMVVSVWDLDTPKERTERRIAYFEAKTARLGGGGDAAQNESENEDEDENESEDEVDETYVAYGADELGEPVDEDCDSDFEDDEQADYEPPEAAPEAASEQGFFAALKQKYISN